MTSQRYPRGILSHAIQLHVQDSIGLLGDDDLKRTREDFLLQVSRFQCPFRLVFMVLLLLPPTPAAVEGCAIRTMPGDVIRSLPAGSTALNVLRSLLSVIALDGDVSSPRMKPRR